MKASNNIMSHPSETRTLTFIEKGILGFENETQFTLSSYDENTPFYWLKSIHNEEIAFMVIEPSILVQDYAFDLPDEVAQILNIKTEADVFVLVILTIPENPLDMSANLLGPLVFHKNENKGQQLILEHSHYPVQFPVFPEGLPKEESETK